MSETKLTAELRTEFGKGAARRLRRAGMIPAVMYGHGTTPLHIALPAHAAMLALKGANAVLALTIGSDEHLALAKDVQRDPIKPVIEHVDLVVVRKGEKVTVEVPVSTEGEAASETVVTIESQTVALLVEATRIPEAVTVSVDGLAAGTQIKAGDLALPAGAELAGDPDALVVHVTATISQEALDAELSAVDEGARESSGDEGASEEPGDE